MKKLASSTLFRDWYGNFYARFDRQNSTPVSVSLADLAPAFPSPEHDVRKQSSRKAAGPGKHATVTLETMR